MRPYNKLSIRLTICMNDAPIGARLQRGAPLPPYQHTYDNTPAGLAKAQEDMAAVEAYVTKWEKWVPPSPPKVKELI